MSHATVNKIAYQRRLSEMLKWGLGPEICELLDDPTVIEIMLNPGGELWIERLGCPMEKFGRMDATQAESLMASIASQINEKINAQSPILECELPLDGSRFEGMLPPVVTSPAFAIRKKAISVFTLDDYVTSGIMTQAQRVALVDAVVKKDNILIVGGTGSGKTTLTNAVLREIAEACPEDRIVILEDTRELQCEAKNTVSLRAVEHVDMTRLLKGTMRLRPDRIVVGEVRDKAIHALLKSWITGHPGGAGTLHANSAYGALTRIEQLLKESVTTPMPELIAEAVNLIVYIEKFNGSRRVKELLRVDGYDGQKYITSLIGENNV